MDEFQALTPLMTITAQHRNYIRFILQFVNPKALTPLMTTAAHHRNYTRFQNALAELQNAKQELATIKADPAVDSSITDAITGIIEGIDSTWHVTNDQMGRLLTDFKPEIPTKNP